MKKIIKSEYQISIKHPNKATTYTSLICVILLSIHVQAQTQYVFQSEAPIANFTWDENDTSRYEGHYRFEQAYCMIEDMLTDKRPLDLAEANFAVENCLYDGQFVPSKKGGVISLNRDGSWASAIPEETFHALQKDNKCKYNDAQLNLEFEAKVFVIMSGLPTGSYYGMDESYHKSLLRMDISEFTQPQSIIEYIKQANIYSTYNEGRAIGNINYWTPTTISPYNLISIIGKLK